MNITPIPAAPPPTPTLPTREGRGILAAEADEVLQTRINLCRVIRSRFSLSSSIHVSPEEFGCFRLQGGRIVPGLEFADERSRLLFRADAHKCGEKVDGCYWRLGSEDIALYVRGAPHKQLNDQRVETFWGSWREFRSEIEVNSSTDLSPRRFSELSAIELNQFNNRARALILPGRDHRVEGSETPLSVPLIALHSTNHLPNEGEIRTGGTTVQIRDRQTIHFTLNGVATAAGMFYTDAWKAKKYFVITPLADLMALNAPLGVNPADTFFPSPVKLAATSKILTSWPCAESLISSVSSCFEIDRGWWLGWGPSVQPHEIFGVFGGYHSDHWTGRYEEFRRTGHDHITSIRVLFEPTLKSITGKRRIEALGEITTQLNVLGFITDPVRSFLREYSSN